MIYDYYSPLALLALLGGVVGLLSQFVWIWGIWKGTMRHNIATWLLWSVIDVSVLISSVAGGAPAPFLSIGFALGAILVTTALFFKGTWHWGALESICAVTTLACLVMWYFAGPIVAVVSLTLGKYGIAGMPAIVNAYRHPERGQSWNWFVGALAAATNIFAAGSWTLAQGFFPSIAFIFSTIIGIIHLLRQKLKV
ncbi:MAG: hypothetical protein Q7R90_02435 [bacterium]|nr:hypothetical protein [bacterium]